MLIAHIAPFAPNRCGLYEAARDMARADIISGHDVYFIDSGINVSGTQTFTPIGSVDDRAGFRLTTADPNIIDSANVLVLHTGIPDAWLIKNQAPIVWIVHGRPLASFRPEQNGATKSYSVYASVAKWPRTKKMVYFWPEFNPYWDVIFPTEKTEVFDYPPIDSERFSPNGDKHVIEDKHKGKYNGLICDSWREDIDLYETVSGAIEAARAIPGLKWHLYGFENPISECWTYLINELYRLNAMGELCGRMPDMEKIYRGSDFLLTPNRIVTRVTGEALSCGLPVVAANGCKVAQQTADMSDPYSIAEAVSEMVGELESSKEVVKSNALIQARKFNLKTFGERMTKVYEQIG